MTTVTVYRSSDASAPSLTGQAGGLITVLDACLVNGYGSQANAGWTKSFSGTNKAAYRNSAVDGTGFYLHIDDTGTNNTAKEALMTGFEVMTAIDTGTGQFPTSEQLNPFAGSVTGGVVCRKSTTADSTARAWTCVADDTCFYLFTETGDQAQPTAAMTFAFGDIFSYKSSDAYRCIIIGRNAGNSASSGNEAFGGLLAPGATGSASIIGHFMPRSWTALGTSITVGKSIDYYMTGTTSYNCGTTGNSGTSNFANGACVGAYGAGTSIPYPNGPDGGLYLSPLWINHSSARRGYLKGAWCPVQDRPLNHNDTYSGTGNLAGKSFLVQWIYVTAVNGMVPASIGQVHIETSSTWS